MSLNTLCNLEGLLGHLPEPERLELEKLILSFPCLFGDTPTQTKPPVRQRFYQVKPEKRKYLDSEIE